jgi:hypothetical protein
MDANDERNMELGREVKDMREHFYLHEKQGI